MRTHQNQSLPFISCIVHNCLETTFFVLLLQHPGHPTTTMWPIVDTPCISLDHHHDFPEPATSSRDLGLLQHVCVEAACQVSRGLEKKKRIISTIRLVRIKMNSNFITHRRHILSPRFSKFSFATNSPIESSSLTIRKNGDLGTQKVSVHVFDALSLSAIY